MTRRAPFPEPLLRVLPELATLDLPAEPLADCLRCPMIPGPDHPPGRWRFSADTRCCTYHPDLANFLVGRALRRGGPGADRIRRRIARGTGVTARGIQAPSAWRARYEATRDTAFGRDPGLRCPYWVGGDRPCGIWPDRNGVCRTWFCRSTGGWPVQRGWRALGRLLSRVEAALAQACAAQADAPAPGAPTEAWVRWYLGCADTVDRLTPAAAERIRPEAADTALDAVTAAFSSIGPPPLPDVLIANVQEVRPLPGGFALCGYSRFDEVEVPSDVFAFLGRLDGATPWREALAAARRHGCRVTEDQIRRLYAIRALKAPSEQDDPHAGPPPDPGALLASRTG